MDIMTHAKFYFNRLMLTLIFAIWASEPPRAWRTTKKAGPDRVKGVERGGTDNHKRAEFWLPNFGFKRSLLSLLKFSIP